MTPPEAVATNAAAIRVLAGRLEREGWTGDSLAAAEEFAALLASHGWAPLEPAPTLRGPTSSKAGRRAARELFEQTRRAKEQAE